MAVADEYDPGKDDPIVCESPKRNKLLFRWLKLKVLR